MRKILSLFISFCILLISVPNSKASTTFFPPELKNEYDYYIIRDFKEGFAIVERSYGLYRQKGFIDRTGKEIVPTNYDEVYNFYNGLAKVKNYSKYGFVDKFGREVIPTIYDYVEYDDCTGLIIAVYKGKWGIIDKTGKEIVNFKYDRIRSYNEGLALVNKFYEGYGFIDKTGKVVIPLNNEYQQAFSFVEGLAPVQKNYKWGFIDKTGKEVVPFKYDEVTVSSEGLAKVKLNNKYGFVDKTGKEVIPIIYDYAESFNKGLAYVIKDKQYGFIDKTGKEVIPVIYDRVERVDENFIFAYKDGSSIIFDNTGKEVSYEEYYNKTNNFDDSIEKERNLIGQLKYDEVCEFKDGIAKVRSNGKWGFIDKTGKEIVPLIYDEVSDFYYGIAAVRKGDYGTGKWGFIDKTGKELTQIIYDNIEYKSEGKWFVRQKSKFAIVDTLTINVSSIKLNESKKILSLGQSFNLIATILPENATDKGIIWSSGNKNVAIVDNKGKVTAVGIGDAIIAAQTLDGGKVAFCYVIVNPIKVTGIKINKTSLILKKKEKAKLIATVLPTNATNKGVVWSSSNKKVITIDKNGNITAVGKGKALVTVKTLDGAKTAFCKIEVK